MALTSSLLITHLTFQNRYTDVLCYDHTRVVLRRDDNDPDSDYVNANYVDGYKQRNAFISMQVVRVRVQQELSSPSPVPNPSPKSKSHIKVPNPKSKVQRKETGTGADTIILQAFNDLLRPFITFYD